MATRPGRISRRRAALLCARTARRDLPGSTTRSRACRPWAAARTPAPPAAGARIGHPLPGDEGRGGSRNRMFPACSPSTAISEQTRPMSQSAAASAEIALLSLMAVTISMPRSIATTVRATDPAPEHPGCTTHQARQARCHRSQLIHQVRREAFRPCDRKPGRGDDGRMDDAWNALDESRDQRLQVFWYLRHLTRRSARRARDRYTIADSAGRFAFNAGSRLNGRSRS